MKNSRLLEALREEVESIVSKLADSVYRVEYPRRERRSFDYIIRVGDKPVLIKTVANIEELSRDEASELKALSRVLKAPHIVVGVKDRWGRLEDCVAYERQGVYAVSAETLRIILKGEEQIFIINKKGGFYANINGRKLRELREAKRMSLGEVASVLGVTRKTVYEYEKQAMDVNIEAASKLIDIFGDDVVKPLNLLDLAASDKDDRSAIGSEPDEPVEGAIVEEARRRGGHAAHTKKTPIDVALEARQERVGLVVKHRRDHKKLVIRAEEVANIAGMLRLQPYAIVDECSSEIRKDLEGVGLQVIDKRLYMEVFERQRAYEG